MNNDWEDFKKTVNTLDKKNLKVGRTNFSQNKNEGTKINFEIQIESNRKKESLEKNTLKKIQRGKIRIEKKLDLHGYTIEESRIKVIEFVNKNYQNCNRLILIITGKGARLGVSDGWRGTGKIKENLPKWLKSIELSDKILWFDKAPRTKGGDGAVLIYLKKIKE